MNDITIIRDEFFTESSRTGKGVRYGVKIDDRIVMWCGDEREVLQHFPDAPVMVDEDGIPLSEYDRRDPAPWESKQFPLDIPADVAPCPTCGTLIGETALRRLPDDDGTPLFGCVHCNGFNYSPATWADVRAAQCPEGQLDLCEQCCNFECPRCPNATFAPTEDVPEVGSNTTSDFECPECGNPAHRCTCNPAADYIDFAMNRIAPKTKRQRKVEALQARFNEATTPRAAACAIRDYCLLIEPNANLVLWSPQESEDMGYGRAWHVMWEEGPHEWAVCISLGSSIHAGTTERYSEPGEFVTTGNPRFVCEPYCNFSLQIWKS